MIQILKHKDQERYAARIRELGLTTYGDTKEEALRKLPMMLASFLGAHIEHNRVASVLRRSSELSQDFGVTDPWEWATDAEKPTPPDAQQGG